MANTVFESALVTMRQLVDAVEAEIHRQSSVEVRAQGAQQRLDALRVQERDLQKLLQELAPQVYAARQSITEAETVAKRTLQDGERQKDKIIADARVVAQQMVEDGHKAGLAAVYVAQKEAASYSDRIAAAKSELASIQAQVKDIQGHVNIAQDALSKMRQSAAAFAAG